MEKVSGEVRARLTFDCDEVFTLKPGSYLIGNAASKDFTHDIGINDPSLDTKHAAIVVSDDLIQIMDLFSQHGTYIDGKRLKRFEVVELSKSLKIQFGSVVAYFNMANKSDSGFLGLNDSTDKNISIVPSTQKNRNESALSRTQDRYQNVATTSTVLAKQSSSELFQNDDEDDDSIVKATQEPNRWTSRNNVSASNQLIASLLEEDDDFFIPETQEVIRENQLNAEMNDSCDMFQLNTQDFNVGSENCNNSDDLIGNVSYAESMNIPYVDVPKLDVSDEKNECNAPSTQPVSSVKPICENNDENDSDTDCEAELSNLRPDQNEKCVTPVLENQRSESVTPDLNIGEQEFDKDILEPTQAFIRPNLNNCITTDNHNPSESQTGKETNSESHLNLDPTEAFAVPAASTLKNNESNSFGAFEETQLFQPAAQKEKETHSFSVPSIAQFERTKKAKIGIAEESIVEESNDESIEPTQVFKQPQVQHSITKSDGISEDLNDFEPTQKFALPVSVPVCSRQKSPSPVLLDSDEEDKDSQFCLAETLVVDDKPKAVCFNHSANSPQKVRRANRLFDSDDEDEVSSIGKTPQCKSGPSQSKSSTIWDDATVQPTPDFGFFKLPSINKLDEADAIFYAKSKRMVRCKTLLELSSDEDNENDPVNALNKFLRGDGNSKINKPEACSSKKVEHGDQKQRKKSVRKSSSSSSSFDLEKEESRSSRPHTSKSKKRNTSHDNKCTLNVERKERNKESPEKHRRKRSASPSKGPRSEKQPKITSTTSGQKINKRELRQKKENKVRKRSISSEQTEKRELRHNNNKNTDASSNKTTSVKNLKENTCSETKVQKSCSDSKAIDCKHEKNSSFSLNEPLSKKQEKVSTKNSSSVTHNGKKGHVKLDKDSSLNEQVKIDKDERNVCKQDKRLNNSFTNKPQRKFSEITSGKKLAEEKLLNIKTSNITFPIELQKCKVILQKKMLDKIPESNDDEAKKQHRSRKVESKVPRKRNKENDPSNLQPVIEKVVIPLRKSSRSSKPRILFTKMDSRPHEKTIEKIGGIIVQDPADCTVLVTPHLSLTWKLFSAIGRGVPIVTDKWLRDALTLKYKNNDKLPNCDKYLIKDKKQEARFNFNLRESLEKARKSKLFVGYTFHCTRNTKPTPKEMQSIIECSGGKMVKSITKDFVRPDKFFIISNKNDIATWTDIRNIVGNAPVIDENTILKVVMQQNIRFESYLISR